MDQTKTYLPNSRWCFVCGEENSAGLGVRFYVENGTVKVRWRAGDKHCGYQHVAHGGVIAAVLDECMGWAAARAVQRMCVTGELTVRYLKPVPSDRDLTVSTEVVKASRRLIHVTSGLADDGGVEYARGEGRFVPLSAAETLAIDDRLRYRGDEERVFQSLRESTARQ